jgi:hypothetical protein
VGLPWTSKDFNHDVDDGAAINRRALRAATSC